MSICKIDQAVTETMGGDTPPAPPPASAAADGGMDGVSLPRGVIRGESSPIEPYPEGGEKIELRLRGKKVRQVFIPVAKPGANPCAALTDWLNVTFAFRVSDESIRDLRLQVTAYLGERLGGLTPRKGGLHGYERSFTFDAGGAMFACGGQAGTAFLSLPGDACALVWDWPQAVAFLRDGLQARITRWDGAVDDYYGHYNVDDAVSWYQAGGFNAWGSKPSCNQNGNWIAPDGRGRTFYVGLRESGKMMRIYEKGKQLGLPDHPWVRWELELHNTDREIPFDVLLEPGRYVAGAYPCMAWVEEDANRVRTIRKIGEIGYEQLCSQLRNAYGRMINVMMQVEGSADKVVEKLRREGVPARLRLPEIEGGLFGTEPP
jgi:phage replication initiation protein